MKKITAFISAAVISIGSIFCGAINTSATNIYVRNFYEDYLQYVKVDSDLDDTYDYIEIYSCDEAAVSVEIPSEIDGLPVVSILDYAFSKCTFLESVTIPDSIENIGSCAFDNTPLYNNQNSEVKYAGNWVIGCDKNATNVSIRNGTVGIIGGAFQLNENLKSISLPNSLKVIGKFAFNNCSALESIKLPQSLTTIGEGAFGACMSLKEISIPKNVIGISALTFNYCPSLESVTIENPNCAIEDCDYIFDNGYDDNGISFFNGTIYGYENSTAQIYAEKYGYNFKIAEPVSDILYGDANEDDIVNVRDCAFIASALAKGNSDSLPQSADYNTDGKINVRDAAAIAAALAKGTI